MKTGYAKLTATTQHFLDTCPAVVSWTHQGDSCASFVYDGSVDVPFVPLGVDFAGDEA